MKRIVLFTLLGLGSVFQLNAGQTDQEKCRQSGGSPHTHLSGRVTCHYHGGHILGDRHFSSEEDCLNSGGRPHSHLSGRVSCHY